jgi:nucleotide-binding universal stress UspA family protein
MVQHLIVPVDGSDASWRAVDVAVMLARRCDATVDVLEIAFDEPSELEARGQLAQRLVQHDTDGVSVTTLVRQASDSVAKGIAAELEEHPEATVVMASHGRGRSAALLGSVAEELLSLAFGPVLVVGPRCLAHDFSGPIVVTVDGSDASESVLPLAAAWGIEMATQPWIVEVADPDSGVSADVNESAYTARLARRLAADSRHPVQYEVLHGHSIHDEIADFASSLHASLIVASTHGRTGMPRFVLGSTAAGIVREAPCPVLLVRPPHLHETTTRH